jgi:hypothetical protein
MADSAISSGGLDGIWINFLQEVLARAAQRRPEARKIRLKYSLFIAFT